MSETSTIEWTMATWNPVRGCTKISPGCKHCYAETFAERFRGVPGHPYEQGFDLRLVPDKLAEPLRWGKPKTIFVNSMSDLFHESVPDDYILDVATVMACANWHTYQVLTKRSERMMTMLSSSLTQFAQANHIWWGVSVEDRRYGLPRIDDLRQAPAAVRFLSVEPLLEDLGEIDLDGIHWVIVGGESGHGARPMEAEPRAIWRRWRTGRTRPIDEQPLADNFWASSTGRNPGVVRIMPGPHDALRESLPLRELLTHYLTSKQQSPGQEWHDRLMTIGSLDPTEVSKLHGHLLANGWVDTRVALEVFNTPGRLASCYKITPDGARALQWASKEADWEEAEQETGWN